jgi:uncharacterized protein (UPF0332 family)
VAILKPQHLFEQAERLTSLRPGRPREADVRRAISTAYYGLFHPILTEAADLYVGSTNRNTGRYGLVYRSVNHDWLRDLCREVQKPTLTNRFKPYAPSNGFGPNIAEFAIAACELQQKRHAADYNVMIRMDRSDAAVAIKTARAALVRFNKATESSRVAFLSLLLFQPRA